VRKEYDTIIIGGGAVGSSIAFHLSEAGADGIAVIDGSFPMCGASGATQAWVWVHTKTPAWYGELSFYSAELYKDLDRKLGNIEYRRTGGICPFFTAQERDAAQTLVASQAPVGIDIEILDRDEALRREPALSKDILGATYCALDGNVNPLRLVQQYMRMAKKQGVTYEMYNRISGIAKKQGVFTLETRKGTFSCKNLVISSGAHSNNIGKMLALNIPVRPVRGQVIITEAVAPLLRHTLAPGYASRSRVVGMRQMVNGEILIGFSKEEAGFDRSTTLDILGKAAQLGIKMIPALAKAKVIRSFAGLRPMPEDGYPILGPIPGIENLFLAVMHSGVTLSPLVGTLMTELLQHRETSLPIEKLSINRFAGSN
jgi:sarcosine oxidase subunit beta